MAAVVHGAAAAVTGSWREGLFIAAFVLDAASAVTESCCEELFIAALVHGAASVVPTGPVGSLIFCRLGPRSRACGSGVPVHLI